MSKLPVLKYRELVIILQKNGFIFKRQAKGSHEIWFHPTSMRFVTIPRHEGKTLKKGTLSAIIRDSGLGKKSFQK